MEQRRLGRTDLHVPVLCFGTMLFGESLEQQGAFRQLDLCWEYGCNFFDSAEM
jgi:aryl-alcohol dehydrogenase-like predicted oxidoreductase